MNTLFKLVLVWDIAIGLIIVAGFTMCEKDLRAGVKVGVKVSDQ